MKTNIIDLILLPKSKMKPMEKNKKGSNNKTKSRKNLKKRRVDEENIRIEQDGRVN